MPFEMACALSCLVVRMSVFFFSLLSSARVCEEMVFFCGEAVGRSRLY